jgi:hypothetical protein
VKILFRISAAIFLGMILIIVESFIVMALKGYSTFQLGSIEQVVGVFAMNFFLVFAILTDIKRWMDKRDSADPEVG